MTKGIFHCEERRVKMNPNIVLLLYVKCDITKAIIGRSQTTMSTIYTQIRGLAFDSET